MGRLVIADSLDGNAILPIKVGLEWAQKLNERPFILNGDKLADYETLDSVFAHLNLEVHQNYVSNILSANREAIERQLETIDSPIKNIDYDSRSGLPVDIILNEAANEDVDLIVLGHNMDKKLSRLFLGGVTEGIVHKSTKSVLITKSSKTLNPKKILVAFNFTYYCEESLEWAKKLAKVFNSQIKLVNVVPCYYEGYNVAHTFHNGLSNTLEQVIDEKVTEVESRLYQRVRELKEDGFNANYNVLLDKEGSISQKIIDHAHEHDSDLIIMGTHSRGKLAELFLGSISSKVIKNSPISVLIAK